MLRYFSVLFMLVFMLIFLVKPEAVAKTMYATQILWIEVRGGPGSEYKAVTQIKSGDPVTVLEQQGEWYHIRTAHDEEGWVPSSSLIEKKPLSVQVLALTSQNTKQADLIAHLTEKNNSLKQYAQLFENSQVELKRIEDENIRLKKRRNLLWIAVGVAIFLVGWIIGLITGRFYRQGRSRYRYSFD